MAVLDHHIVASELKDPICHSDECQIGSFSSEATIYRGLHILFVTLEVLNCFLILLFCLNLLKVLYEIKIFF